MKIGAEIRCGYADLTNENRQILRRVALSSCTQSSILDSRNGNPFPVLLAAGAYL
jgi:hypothetical protein